MILLAPVVGVITAIGVFIACGILELPFTLLFGKAYKDEALEQIWSEAKPPILNDEDRTALIKASLQHGENLYNQRSDDPYQWSNCTMAMVRARDLATKFGWTDWAEEIDTRFKDMKYVYEKQIRDCG